ncbi:hypothetical protein DVH05_004862 [Phytophthora capsici]|nr:hypothetical protein DVH05_004862 [Phytophthora capsici]
MLLPLLANADALYMHSRRVKEGGGRRRVVQWVASLVYALAARVRARAAAVLHERTLITTACCVRTLWPVYKVGVCNGGRRRVVQWVARLVSTLAARVRARAAAVLHERTLITTACCVRTLWPVYKVGVCNGGRRRVVQWVARLVSALAARVRVRAAAVLHERTLITTACCVRTLWPVYKVGVCNGGRRRVVQWVARLVSALAARVRARAAAVLHERTLITTACCVRTLWPVYKVGVCNGGRRRVVQWVARLVSALAARVRARAAAVLHERTLRRS